MTRSRGGSETKIPSSPNGQDIWDVIDTLALILWSPGSPGGPSWLFTLSYLSLATTTATVTQTGAWMSVGLAECVGPPVGCPLLPSVWFCAGAGAGDCACDVRPCKAQYLDTARRSLSAPSPGLSPPVSPAQLTPPALRASLRISSPCRAFACARLVPVTGGRGGEVLPSSSLARVQRTRWYCRHGLGLSGPDQTRDCYHGPASVKHRSGVRERESPLGPVLLVPRPSSLDPVSGACMYLRVAEQIGRL